MLVRDDAKTTVLSVGRPILLRRSSSSALLSLFTGAALVQVSAAICPLASLSDSALRLASASAFNFARAISTRSSKDNLRSVPSPDFSEQTALFSARAIRASDPTRLPHELISVPPNGSLK